MCGEMNVPTTSPWAQASAVTSRAVVVLPFVPVMWIVGYVSSGWSSSSTNLEIRSRFGLGMCSGCRPSSARTASRKFIGGVPYAPRSAELLPLRGQRRRLLLQRRQAVPLGTDDVPGGLRDERRVAQLAAAAGGFGVDVGEALGDPGPFDVGIEHPR